MAKTIHTCTACGHEHPKWVGQCKSCGEWGTVEESKVDSSATKASAKHTLRSSSKRSPATVTSLSEHRPQDTPRFSTQIPELDRVLGGGLVPGSAAVLSGAPGSGKSTLSSTLASKVASEGKRVLYVAGEESGHQIRRRTDRMKIANGDQIDICAETEVNTVCATIASGYDLAIIDSAQTLYDDEMSGAPGSVSIIKHVGHLLRLTAKSTNCAVLIIGHVTKDGSLAGPKHFEHMVDVVLSMEGDHGQALRTLRAQKNRFGATDEIGVFEMTALGLLEVEDPSSAFTTNRVDDLAGAVICPTADGTRPMLVEVQALVSPTNNPSPRRIAQGIDKARLDMMIAVMAQATGMRLTALRTSDVYVSVSGGFRVVETAVDLAVCVAIASAVHQVPVKRGTAVFGEVSLLGEVRPVPAGTRRTSEAKRLGWPKVISAPGQGTASHETLKRAVYDALDDGPPSERYSADIQDTGEGSAETDGAAPAPVAA